MPFHPDDLPEQVQLMAEGCARLAATIGRNATRDPRAAKDDAELLRRNAHTLAVWLRLIDNAQPLT